MTANQTKWDSTPIPDEVMGKICSDFRIRNVIAYAETVEDHRGNHLEFVAVIYPNRYSVTTEQILAAQTQLENDKKAAIARLEGSGILLVVGLGSHRITDLYGIDNYRVRAQWKDRNGNLFLLEVAQTNELKMFCTHSIDLTLEKLADEAEREGGARICQSKFYNCKKLESQAALGEYTKARLLSIINEKFDCHFKGIEIDSYTLRIEDYENVSP